MHNYFRKGRQNAYGTIFLKENVLPNLKLGMILTIFMALEIMPVKKWEINNMACCNIIYCRFHKLEVYSIQA